MPATANPNNAQATVTPVVTPQPGQPTTPAPAQTQTPAQDPAQAPSNNPPQDAALTAPDNVVAMIEKARQDEKAKLYGTLEKVKADAKANAEALEAANTKLKEMEVIANKDLTADQRVEARITALQEQIASEKKAREEDAKRHTEENRRIELDSYKHRRLAEVGVANLIPEFVGGDSPEAIDASILVAQAEYQRLRQKMFQEFAAEHGTQGTGDVPSSVGGSPVTPSPHFTPNEAVGFPSQVNPMPVAEQSIDMNTLANMTSEEAVRSGAYEQVRGQLLSNLKQAAGSMGGTPLGSAPRHMAVPSNVPHVEGPNGVMQPTGYPTGPVHPASVQPGRAAPNVGGQPTDPRAAAIEAVNRTNAGQNPLMNQQPGGAPTGPTPQGDAGAAAAAFQQRFTPTPPLR